MLDSKQPFMLTYARMNANTTENTVKTNTHIAVVLDRSGSMQGMRAEIIGGFNAFLEDQKTVPGTATLTLVQFDNEIDRLTDGVPLAGIKPLDESTYVPRGATKLYDAIGLTVNSVKEAIAKAAAKPDKVIVLILTDGQENSSQEYTTDSIKSLLEAQQKDGWQFSFIGANQDAILTARGIGLNNAASNITYAATKAGSTNVLRSMSASVKMFRCAPQDAQFAYKQEDRDAQSIDPAEATVASVKATFSEQGSKMASSGGNARAASLSPERRTSIASDAAKARWSRKSV
jgi:uncharacterized protein YegL